MIHSVPETTSVALSVGQGVRDRSGAKANSEPTNIQEKKSALQLASPSEDRKDASETQAAIGTQEATATKDAVALNQDLKEKVAQIQSKIDQIDSKVKFSVEEDLDRVIVKVVERESGELIRQIPSEEVLQAQRFFEEHSGILLEEEA
ncbi:MAG: flagellar protein FlaG [Nitrospirales bacterium]